MPKRREERTVGRGVSGRSRLRIEEQRWKSHRKIRKHHWSVLSCLQKKSSSTVCSRWESHILFVKDKALTKIVMLMVIKVRERKEKGVEETRWKTVVGDAVKKFATSYSYSQYRCPNFVERANPWQTLSQNFQLTFCNDAFDNLSESVPSFQKAFRHVCRVSIALKCVQESRGDLWSLVKLVQMLAFILFWREESLEPSQIPQSTKLLFLPFISSIPLPSSLSSRV